MSEVTAKQQEVLDWLAEHPWSTTEQVADGVGTTLRGAGNRLSKLLWANRLRVRADPSGSWAESLYAAKEAE